MSMPEEMTIQCPECGKTSEVTVFQSINDSWPSAVEKILSGELFAFICPHCGRKDHLEYDILFNDFGHQAWIQVVHEEELIPTYEKIMDVNANYMEGVRFRIVHNSYELREKVLAFSLGRDDRIIELCKCFVADMAQKKIPDFKLSGAPIYTHSPETGQEAFLLLVENGEEKIAVIDDLLYDAVEQTYQKYHDRDHSKYVYDYAWAEALIFNTGVE